jgi:DNA-directed RNA polymerase subunit H
MIKMASTKAVKHRLIPVHSKLSKTESKELLASYNITIAQLPKILIKDAAIAHLKLEVGDIIKIERDSPTIGKSYYYRVVVNE